MRSLNMNKKPRKLRLWLPWCDWRRKQLSKKALLEIFTAQEESIQSFFLTRINKTSDFWEIRICTESELITIIQATVKCLKLLFHKLSLDSENPRVIFCFSLVLVSLRPVSATVVLWHWPYRTHNSSSPCANLQDSPKVHLPASQYAHILPFFPSGLWFPVALVSQRKVERQSTSQFLSSGRGGSGGFGIASHQGGGRYLLFTLIFNTSEVWMFQCTALAYWPSPRHMADPRPGS